MTHTFLSSLAAAGKTGLTYNARDKTLALVFPEVKRLRKQGVNIREEILNTHKVTPLGKRIRFTLEGGEI